MRLEKLARMSVAVLNVDDMLNRAMQQMWALNIRHLPITDRGSLVGMVSDRDILLHVCWHEFTGSPVASQRGAPLTGASRIDSIMTTPAVSLTPEDDVEKAARLMLNKRIGAVPLATNAGVFGIVTETDLLRCFVDTTEAATAGIERNELVTERMSNNVFTVAPNDATLAAVRLMREKQIRHVPVLSGDELVGIVSDRDVLRGTPRGELHTNDARPFDVDDLRAADHHATIGGIMSTDLITLTPEATLGVAAQQMAAHKISAIPIVEDGRLMGIISETDLLRLFLSDSLA